MVTVYVVIYSDGYDITSVSGVYSTFENAKAAKGHGEDIEAYVLDGEESEEGN